MTISNLKKAFAGATIVATAFAPVLVARAATYTQNSPLVVGSTTLTVQAGSQYDTLTTTDSGFTVKVEEGEAFVVRAPGGSPRSLENDVLEQPCHVLRSLENQLIINGPRTATVTIGTSGCSTADADDDLTPMLTIQTPNGAATYQGGQEVQVFWGGTGRTVPNVRLALSTDGGQTYSTVIADNQFNSGFYAWTVPTLPYNVRARLRLQGLDQGRIVAMDVSDADFVIAGTNGDGPSVPEGETPDSPSAHPPYDPAVATATASTIDADRGFQSLPQLVGSTACTPGTRIKGASSAAVYYCGKDGKRHAFPNQRIHDSWFEGWNGVVTLTDAQLAAIALGKNVTYRPGVRLLKIVSDPKVYAVAANGELRWIPDEWTARDLYGLDWNKMVDDVPDAFFGNDYHIGEPVPAN